MSFADLYKSASESEQPPYRTLFPGRAETIQRIDSTPVFDALVVGGGIHGAMFARIAALHGLKTLLLERVDYASGTSGRSSRMAHGGLRYLERLDLAQVFEGIRAREDLLNTASHLVRSYPFLIPLTEDQYVMKAKLALGLRIYDLFARSPGKRHRWLKASELPAGIADIAGRPASGAYMFYDGLMSDSRLVIENIVAARQEGAVCLNHASVESVQTLGDHSQLVGWFDRLTRKNHEVRAGVVVNCAGPWVPTVGRVRPGELAEKIRYSQGIHLLFNQPWNDPAVLRAAGRGQHYFIWPHFSGTMVGTSEREVTVLEDDPLPQREEVSFLLDKLSHDFPRLGLDRSRMHYCFAGVRTLPVRGTRGGTSALSRRHMWIFYGGMLNLIGGKFTTASWTVHQGMKMLLKLAGKDLEAQPLKGRKLPGSGSLQLGTSEFMEAAVDKGVPPEICNRVLGRLGSRARHILEFERGFEVMGGNILRGELELALDVEQAESLEDIMRRRLDLEYLPGNGLETMPAIAVLLGEKRPTVDIPAEMSAYRERMERVRAVMQ